MTSALLTKPLKKRAGTRVEALLAIAFLLYLALQPALAQVARGTLRGRITDATGAVVPGVDISATHKSTGLGSTTLSNELGDWVLPQLEIGLYQLKLELPGFRSYIQEDLEVRIQDELVLDIVLQVGELADAVTVTGETPILNMGTASLGTVMDERKITDLPLGHGAPTFLVALVPGGTITSIGGITPQRMQRSWTASFRINGSPRGTNEYLIDGSPNAQTQNGVGGVSFNPQAEVVEQVKIQTADYDAAVGHGGGSVINVALKSGTNSYHGSAYRYWRDTAFNANDFFRNSSGTERPNVIYRRFGGAAGGPIIKNKFFFHYGWDRWNEGFRFSQAATIPTPEQINGDFSGLLALGPQYQIYDPATIAPAPGGRFSIQPFQGNIIPANRIDPLAKQIAEYIWNPTEVPINLPGTADGRNNSLGDFYVDGSRADYASALKLDYQLTDSHRLSGSFIKSETRIPFAALLGRRDLPGTFTGFKPVHYTFEDVWIINPSLTANFRISNMRFGNTNKGAGAGDFDSLGFGPNIAALNAALGESYPHLNIVGEHDLIDFPEGSCCIPDRNRIRGSDIWSTVARFNAIRGNHTLKFGSDLRLYRIFEGREPQMSQRFDTTYTRGPFDTSTAAPIGQGMTAYLLGIPSSGNVTLEAKTFDESPFYSFYLHDDWRVSPKLTLSLGLRWEREAPTFERHGQTVYRYDFATPSPIQAAAQANYAANPIPEIPANQFMTPGGLTFASPAQQLWDADNNNFLPRIGFAYRMTEDTVIRGGYGIFMIPLALRQQGVRSIPTGFSQPTSLIPTLDNGQTFIASLGDPFPNGLLQPVGSAAGLLTNVGRTVNFFNTDMVNPYNQRWSLSVQQQWSDWVFELGYVGNRTTQFPIRNRDLNALPNQWLSTSGQRDQATIDFLSAQVPNPFFGIAEFDGTSLSTQNVARSQLLKPFPHFTGVRTWANQGFSYYHSLQAEVERRFSKGYTFNGNFTWNKLMEATNYLNPGDPLPEKRISNDDYTHGFTAQMIWELPFGPGHRIGGSQTGLARRLIEGWQLQGTYHIQSGWPLSWGNILFNGDLGNINKDNRTIDEWFNTGAGFNRDSTQQLASNLRTFPSRLSSVRRAVNHYFPVSLTKDTHIAERFHVVFYLEAFNVLNKPTFFNPNTSPTSTAFATITRTQNSPRNVQLGLRFVF